MPSGRKSEIQIAWKTVTYRSVVMMILAVLVVMAVGTRLAFPEFSERRIKATNNLLTSLFEHLAQPTNSTPSNGGAQQAHITALDGTVRIKKANSNSWVRADYSVPLDKGAFR